MKKHGTDEEAEKPQPSDADNNEAATGIARFGNNRLPAPAALAIGPLSQLGKDRVRAKLQKNRSWMFNYSIIKLDAPDLAKSLNAWLPSLEATVSPLRVSAIEMTFARPLPKGTPHQDGAEAFTTFARTCSELIDRVAPWKPTTVSLFWSASMPNISDCLNDWRLDLDPIRAEIQRAGELLIREIDVWLRGMDCFILKLEHLGVRDK